MRSLPWMSIALVCVACSHAPPPEPEGPDLGDVMVQVARRFEIAGRAAVANRFDLAAFEVGEMGEVFEDDVPRAHLPKEGRTAQIPALAKAFAATAPADLKQAAISHDQARFAAAFARTAALCNGCHASADKGFVEVPAVPGQPVPRLDPVAAPAIP